MEDYDLKDLVKWAREMCPNDPSLVQEIELSAANPIQYWELYDDKHSSRGFDELEDLPRGQLPFFAFLDGLGERDLKREVDWKSSPADVLEAVNELLTVHGKPVLDKQELSGLVGVSPYDSLDHLSSIVKKRYQLRIVTFEIRSDSIPFVLSP